MSIFKAYTFLHTKMSYMLSYIELYDISFTNDMLSANECIFYIKSDTLCMILRNRHFDRGKKFKKNQICCKDKVKEVIFCAMT